jgi:uncharacterized protein (DUF779 family)
LEYLIKQKTTTTKQVYVVIRGAWRHTQLIIECIAGNRSQQLLFIAFESTCIKLIQIQSYYD